MGLLDRFSKPQTKEKFGPLFMAALQRVVPGPMRFEMEHFHIVVGNKKDGHVVNLINFYNEYCRLPAKERQQYLAQVAKSVQIRPDLPEDFAEAKPNLRPKLWARAGIEKMELEALLRGGKGLAMPRYTVGSHLLSTVAYDFPDTVRSLSAEELDSWGISYYEALEIARENLEQVPFSMAVIGDNLYASMTGDTYDATRILLVDKIKSMSVQGDHVVMVPSRDTLLITGSEDDVGLAMMLDLAEKAINDPRPLANTPLRLVDDEWEDWMPPKSHSLYDRFKHLEMKYLYVEYKEQKELLDKIDAEKEVDRFVASYSVFQAEGSDEVASFCVWSKSVVTLLPRTEKVLFYVEGQDIVAGASWETVQRVAGHLLESTDFYPERFLVNDFPTDAEFAAIGQEWMPKQAE